jgi:hypothetical protein
VAEVAADTETVASQVARTTDTTTTTDIDGDGGLSLLGRWLIRFWFRITIRRR